MTGQDAETAGDTVDLKVAAAIDYVEQKSIFDGYARLYGPLTMAAIGLVFVPIFDDVVKEDDYGSMVTRYGTLFDMAGAAAGGPAALGIILVVSLAVLTGISTFRPRSYALPVAIAAVCMPVIIMLIARPGTGDPTPDFSSAGTAGLAIVIFACALSIAHAIHYYLWSRDDEPRRAAIGLK